MKNSIYFVLSASAFLMVACGRASGPAAARDLSETVHQATLTKDKVSSQSQIQNKDLSQAQNLIKNQSASPTPTCTPIQIVKDAPVAASLPIQAPIVQLASAPQVVKPAKLDAPVVVPVPPTQMTALSYSDVKQAVFAPRCIKCHSVAGKNRGHVNLETFGETIKDIGGIKDSILDGSMPWDKPALSDEQKNIVLSWIEQGAHEVAGAPIESSSMPTNGALSIAHPSAPLPTDDITKQGKYIFGAAGCAHCHTSDLDKPLAGGLALRSPFGTFYVPNISPDKVTGIGSWTEEQFFKAVREGVSPQGYDYYPSFPFTSYSKLSDEDIHALRAYLLTWPAISQPNKPHKLMKAFSIRSSLFFWRSVNFVSYSKKDERNLIYEPGPFVPYANHSGQWNRGAYLIEGAFHCAQCHTPRGMLGGMIKESLMSGAKLFGEPDPAPNLTPDVETGTGSWTREDWKKFLKTGFTPKAHSVGGDMKKIVKFGTSQLTESDLDSIIDYLQSLRPVKHKLTAPSPAAQ